MNDMNDNHHDGLSGSGGPHVDFEKYEEKKVRAFTDRPAPLLPGFHCLLALTESNHGLQVTSYHRDLGSIMGLMAKLPSKSEFSTCLIKTNQIDVWTCFDSRRFITGSYEQIVTQPIPEWREEIQVSREEFTAQARESLDIDLLLLLACSEFHPGASAADHSNLSLMLHRMITEASDGDLQHVFLVESKKWTCRVTGFFATIEELTPEHQDRYLDRRKSLENSWPLEHEHHLESLSHRLALSRGSYMEEVIAECGKASGKSREIILGMLCKWALATPKAKERFARHVVDCLKDGILFEHGKPEVFDGSYTEKRGADVVKDLSEMLR